MRPRSKGKWGPMVLNRKELVRILQARFLVLFGVRRFRDATPLQAVICSSRSEAHRAAFHGGPLPRDAFRRDKGLTISVCIRLAEMGDDPVIVFERAGKLSTTLPTKGSP